jgi:chloramphenicol O-acetyltransferase type A
MKFHVIDKDKWDRSPYFDHFLRLGCSFSITNNLDITALLKQGKQKKIKLYPALIYIVSIVINSNKEFRTCLNDDGQLGYWEQMIPSYTIFHKETKLFSSLWTEFSNEFDRFYQNYLLDLERYGNKDCSFNAKENEPPNTFPISCIPWVEFTGFNLNIKNNDQFLLPIITFGKYFYEGNKTLLPISLQVHHAVCDGYHASKFLLEVQQLADQCEEWLFTIPQL